MYEPWSSGEKINYSLKKSQLNMFLRKRIKTRENSHVKRLAGSDLTVVSSPAKNINREIEQDQKQEAISKRDER